MGLALRPYQSAAIDGLFDYWNDKPGNPLLVLPTGSGKSLVNATIIERLTNGWPDMRILCLTHVKELIEQNYLELLNIWPLAPAGIYSAGLGRRDAHAQVLFAGIQTVHSKARQIGWVDLIIVDEAHLIPRKAGTMYGKFLLALAEINPDIKVVGLTATDWRLDSGRLTEGDGRLFDDVAYEVGIRELMDEGYLTPLVSKGTDTGFDLTGVQKRGGDYIPGQLQAAVDKADTTRAAVDEIVGYGERRKSWLLFCSGVEHAFHVRDEIRSRGFSCETITGETPAGERARILADFKAGKIRSLTNNAVLTTGTNLPSVDLLAFLRPTESAGLYVQMAGRGTRNVYAPGYALDSKEGRLAAIATGPKPNCLVLDFAGLVRRHGPIDAVKPRTPGKGQGEAPVKECPDCHSLLHASLMVCPDCGHEFERKEEGKIEAHAADLPIMSTGDTTWLNVTSRRFDFHDKVGGTPSVRVTFGCGLTQHKTWWCPQHSGYAKAKCDRAWAEHGGLRPFPKSVEEFLRRQDELLETVEISVKPSGRYYEVTAYRVGDKRQVPAMPSAIAAAIAAATPREEFADDDIPF